MMRGLMMDDQLTVPAILRRAETLSPDVEVVARAADRSIRRSRWGDVLLRARRLGAALQDLRIQPGDRVATLGWNHLQHLETYCAVPTVGGVLHTLNVRQHPDELVRVAKDAQDRVLFADAALLPVVDQIRDRAGFELIVIMEGEAPPGTIAFDDLVESGNSARLATPALDERDAAAMCYTSGTTGVPKGVVYSHRAIALHAMHWTAVDVIGASQHDVMLGVIPMFHINGWGMSFTAALTGAKLVLPGRFLDAASLLELIEKERVTMSAGVPTVWLDVLRALEAAPGRDVSSLRRLLVGGAPATSALIKGFERFGVDVVHTWGMTETTALATVASLPPDLARAEPDARDRIRAKQGRPIPFLEVRARSDAGLVPWDGSTPGELEVRGPAVARQYHGVATDAAFSDDGWFRTGDIVTIDSRGFIEIRDRAKDLIRSGGEWISSVLLENELMNHPSVGEAAVVAMPDERWGERPRAFVVVKQGAVVSGREILEFLGARVAKWWVPDVIELVEELPRSATGKVLKRALRDRSRAG